MKDPAVLIYFDKWIASTNGMKADFRGWYMDLLIYQYDKGAIPQDLDELAGICRVRPSEYDAFKQVVKQVLMQKFVQNDDGTWYNEFANEILRKREKFTDKRKKSGNIGVIIKLAMTIKGFNMKWRDRLKTELYKMDSEAIEKHKHKQVLEQKLKLYIDVNEDEDKKVIRDESIYYRQFAHLSITHEDAEKLIKVYSKEKLNDILDSIENHKNNTSYVSLYMTAVKWLKNENGYKPKQDTHELKPQNYDTKL